MPDLDAETGVIIQLRNRCKQYRTLPTAGSMQDQPALLMDLFDIIDEQFATEQKKKADAVEMERAKLKLKANG